MPEETMPSPPPAPKKGLFGRTQEQTGPSAEVNAMQQDMNSVNTRLRISEERYSDLRRKIQLIEENMLSNHKKAMDSIRVVNSEIVDIRRSIKEIEDRLIMVIKELQLTAKKEDLDVVRRYVEMWEPVHFVTAAQVEKMIDEAMQAADEQADKQVNEETIKKRLAPKNQSVLGR